MVVALATTASGIGSGSTCTPNAAETIGAVRGQFEFEASIRKTEVAGQLGTDRRIGRQFEQTGSIGVDAELLGRAQHALRIDATQLRGLDLDATGQDRTDGSQWRFQAGPCVRRAAHDLHCVAIADGDLTDLQPIGLGMFGAGQDLGHQHALQSFADDLHVLDFQADRGQSFGQLFARGGYPDMLAQPAFGKFHANCLRKRTSLSKKLRRSLTP